MKSEKKTDPTNRAYKRWVAAALSCLVACVIADTGVAAQARWEDIVRAAEKEGEVTVYATNSVGDLQVIWDAFRKKFPKIKLNSVGISTTSEIVTKVWPSAAPASFRLTLCLARRARRTTASIAARHSTRCRRRSCCPK